MKWLTALSAFVAVALARSVARPLLHPDGQDVLGLNCEGGREHLTVSTQAINYPSELQYKSAVKGLAQKLDKENTRKVLEKFTSFRSRYYRSDTGKEASDWLYEQVTAMIKNAAADKYSVKVEQFAHTWDQNTLIAKIPGKSNKTVVVAASLGSKNFWPFLPAPGADEDGSGTVANLEAFRGLLSSDIIGQGKAKHSIEFHWYSATEAGNLGSQPVFRQYRQDGIEIVALLGQYMVGHTKQARSDGKSEAIALVTDHSDPKLVEFLKKVVPEYGELPFVETQCGFGCSDHASATDYGYPAAMAMESEWDNKNPHIGTINDRIDQIDFDHLLKHAKMSLGYAYELAMANFG